MNILMYLFSKSISRVDYIILTIVIVLLLSNKVKTALATFIFGGLAVALIEVLLKI